jgi:hypothetical protein
MEEQKKPAGSKKELRQDALVENLVPDPSQYQSVTVLAGFLGKSTRVGYWRLYLTSQLNEYVEFREEDVVHTQPIPPEQSPLGGTLIWLRRDATVHHTHITSRQVQAEFLQGHITSRFLPKTGRSISRISMPRRALFAAGRHASNLGECDPDSADICQTDRPDFTLNLHVPMCASDAGECGPPGSFGCPSGAICPTGAFIEGC